MTATSTDRRVEDGEASARRSVTCTATRHGNRVAYDVDHCRCPDARADHARYERLRTTEALLGRPRRLDATGSARRLRALMANGWDSDTLAWHLGWSGGQAVRRVTKARYIYRTTAERIANLYELLSAHHGPSDRARRCAERAGWLGPLWWDDDTIDDPAHDPCQVREDDAIDEIAVERACTGAVVDLSHPERLEVARRLAARGYLVTHIADRLHVNGAKARQLLAEIEVAA